MKFCLDGSLAHIVYTPRTSPSGFSNALVAVLTTFSNDGIIMTITLEIFTPLNELGASFI